MLTQMGNNFKGHHVCIFTSVGMSNSRRLTVQDTTCESHISSHKVAATWTLEDVSKTFSIPRNTGTARVGDSGNDGYSIPMSSCTRVGTEGNGLTPNAIIEF